MEADLLEVGLSRLGELLGNEFEIASVATEVDLGGDRADRLVQIQDIPGSYSGLALVEAVPSLAPADVARRLEPRVRLMRQLNNGQAAVLVVAEWLSPRTRTVLDEHRFGYLDLTGNVSFRLARPTVLLRLQGADRQPRGARGDAAAGLVGARAGQLVRLLVDMTPPYQARQLSGATGISLPWVGRVLDALEAQLLLLLRDGRTITATDWPGLLRTRAEAVSLLRTNSVIPLQSPRGPGRVLDLIRADPQLASRLAVTGSAAAAAVAPLVTAGQLMFYVRQASDVDGLPRQLQVLRTDQAADVLMLLPGSPAVFDRVRAVDGIPHVALSQVVIDCLSGNGRMPAEGEAVLRWMAEDEARWRRDRLPEAPGQVA